MSKKDIEINMETEICHNCKREVPQQNYLMHVAHCSRNMAVCPVCGDAVPKAHLKEHRQKEHALITCPACRNKVQAGAMENHRASSCGRRTMACEFCELELPKDDLIEHESYCGARTERCECGELVMHKYKKLHLDSNHGFLKLNDEPGPTPSWESRASSSNQLNQNTTIREVLNNSAGATSVNSEIASTVPLKSKKLDEENGFAPVPEAPLRDAPRTFVPAYDASEDLRAKVKLARHDLNNIKNTYLLQGDERVKQLQHKSKSLNNNLELSATNRNPRARFTTNLVPYEKNKSVRVNALPDEERAIVVGTIPQPLPSLRSAVPAQGGFFNYLGAREESNLPVLPLSSINGSIPKNTTTNSTNTGTNITRTNINGNGTGAVPRSSRKKGPAPPIPVKQNVSSISSIPADTNEVTLPCEFCEKPVPASYLVQHETACRPDLAQLRVSSDTNDASATANLPSSPEVQLPCEFCCNLYPASKLLSHQAICDV